MLIAHPRAARPTLHPHFILHCLSRLHSLFLFHSSCSHTTEDLLVSQEAKSPHSFIQQCLLSTSCVPGSVKGSKLAPCCKRLFTAGKPARNHWHWFKCYIWGFFSIDDKQKGVNNYALERDEGPQKNTNREVSKQSWEEGTFYLGLQESI